MAQSDERVPRSFGRPAEPEQVESPKPPVEPPFAVVDGRLVVRVGVDFVVDAAAAQAFYDQVRELTVLAASDGLATVFGRSVGDGDGEAPGPGPDGPPS